MCSVLDDTTTYDNKHRDARRSLASILGILDDGYVCMYMCILLMNVLIHKYMCIYIYICVCVYTYTYIYIHI